MVSTAQHDIWLYYCTEEWMLLAVDIGNTNITLGVFKGEELCAHWRLATDHARMPDEYVSAVAGIAGERWT